MACRLSQSKKMSAPQFVNFISNRYCNELRNSRKQQISMQRFFILRFTSGNTKAVLEVVNGFLNSHCLFHVFKGSAP